MNKSLSSTTLMAGMAFAALISGSAHATWWSIDEVLSGTDGGFGYSSFHDASTGSVMSGTGLGAITGSGAGIGKFNDVSGEFWLTANSGGGVTTFHGTLDFGGGFGWLSSPSSLNVDFDIPTGLLVDTTITFEDKDACCSGTGNAIPGDDPNSIVLINADEAIITLWGANGYVNGAFNNGSGGRTTLGMDLRVRMTRVPEPDTVLLLGIGLLGMAFIRRRSYTHGKRRPS